MYTLKAKKATVQDEENMIRTIVNGLMDCIRRPLMNMATQ
jgi:hypothetical protein